MENLKEMPVGQIAANDYRTCRVFIDYRIDFFNEGKQTLQEAVGKKNINPDEILGKLENVLQTPLEEEQNYNTWDLDKLANYIVETYHKPAEKNIQILKPRIAEICDSKGDAYPELNEIKTLFDKTAGEIAVHQKKEELMLFPFIRKMADAKRNNKPFVRPPVTKSAENPVNMLTHEHHDQGAAFSKIVELNKNYTAPEGIIR